MDAKPPLSGWDYLDGVVRMVMAGELSVAEAEKAIRIGLVCEPEIANGLRGITAWALRLLDDVGRLAPLADGAEQAMRRGRSPRPPHPRVATPAMWAGRAG